LGLREVRHGARVTCTLLSGLAQEVVRERVVPEIFQQEPAVLCVLAEDARHVHAVRGEQLVHLEEGPPGLPLMLSDLLGLASLGHEHRDHRAVAARHSEVLARGRAAGHRLGLDVFFVLGRSAHERVEPVHVELGHGRRI
jgi:hypothetical protein